MAVKVGTFVKQLGATTAVDGVGFKPKAIIFWTVGATDNNVQSTGVLFSFGFWAENRPHDESDGALAYGRAFEHNTLSPIGRYELLSTGTLGVPNNPITFLWQMNVTSVHDDGFVVTFSPAASVPSNMQVHYQALGGPGVRAYTRSVAPPNPGNLFAPWPGVATGTTVSVETGNIHASSAVFLSRYAGHQIADPFVNLAAMSIGFVDEKRKGAAIGGRFGDTENRFHTGYVHPSAPIANMPGLPYAMGVKAFRPGWCDLEVLSAPAIPTYGVEFDAISCLFIEGMRSNVFSFLAGANGQQTYTPTPNFRPSGVFLAAHGRGMVPLAYAHPVSTNTYFDLGASDGSANAASVFYVRDYNNIAPQVDHTDYGTAWTSKISRNDIAHINMAAHNGSLPATIARSITDVTLDDNLKMTWAGAGGDSYPMVAMDWGDITTPLQSTMYLTSFLNAIKMGSPVFLSATVRAIAEFYPQVFGNAGNIANVRMEAVSTVQARLALQHLLTMTVNAVTDLYIATGFGFTRPLSATMAAVSTFTPIKAGTPAPLSPVQFAAISDLFIKYGLSLEHHLVTRISSRLELETRFKTILPTVRAATSYEIAGAVNWHGNPSAESGLIGWFTEGDGPEIVHSTEESWDGAHSIKRITDASNAFQGLSARSFAGLDITGLNPDTGLARRVAGQIRLLGEEDVTLWVWLRARYTDGTEVDGEALEVVLTGTNQENWKVYYPPQLALNPAKPLNFVEVVTATPVAEAVTFYADGAQIEEDKGHGATRFTIGSYGYEAGTWQGYPHISMSYRPPLPSVITGVGIGGEITVEAKMYRATWDNHWIEDISDMVLDATVTMDTSREVTWTLDANFHWDQYQRLNENEDWIAPVLTVRYPNGEVKSGQLGLYFLVPGESTRNEFTSTVQVSAFDPLWLIARQAFTGPVRVLAGAERTKVVRDILNGAVLTGGAEMGPRRYSGPITNKAWKKRREWPKDTDRLTLANELLEGTGMYPLWSVASGEMKWRKRGEDRMADRYPVRVWAANLNPGETVTPFIPRVNYLKSEVVGAIKTKAKAMDAYDEILMINDDPDNKRVRVRGRIKGRGKNMRVVRGRGDRKRVRKLYAPYVDDEATAAEIAAALADELNNRTEHVELSVLPDPSVDYCRETVLLAIWDAYHNPVAVGQFQVNSCKWGFTPTTCLQTMDLSRVDSEAEIETFIL